MEDLGTNYKQNLKHFERFSLYFILSKRETNNIRTQIK